MKVYLDFETGLLNNSIEFSEKLYNMEYKISKKISKNTEKMPFVFPYNPTTLAFIQDNFVNDTIIILVKNYHKHYIDKILDDLVSLFELRIGGCIINDENLNIDSDTVYIGEFRKDIAQNHTIKKYYVNYFPFGLINKLKSENSDYISMGIGGLVFIPLQYSFIIMPVLCNWILWWFSIDKLNQINLNAMFLSVSCFSSLFCIIRTLLELNNERVEFFQNGNEIILGEDFILNNYNLYIGAIFALIFGILGVYCIIKTSIITGLVGIFIALMYNIFVMSSFKIRWFVLTPVLIFGGLVSQFRLFIN